jgi:hypothetical protein
MMDDHHLQEHPVERCPGDPPHLLHLTAGHHARHRAAGTHLTLTHLSHAAHGAVVEGTGAFQALSNPLS